jgi:hypothetical protein
MMHVFPFFIHGSDCPHCHFHAERVRTPFLLRPIRYIYPEAKRRACSRPGCSWRGFAFPVRQESRADPLPQPRG